MTNEEQAAKTGETLGECLLDCNIVTHDEQDAFLKQQAGRLHFPFIMIRVWQ